MKILVKHFFVIIFFACAIFSCTTKNVIPNGMNYHTIYDSIDSIKITFLLDKSYDTLYKWHVSGCTSYDSKSVFQFQNKRTIFIRAPYSSGFSFDTLTDYQIKHFAIRHFSIGIRNKKEKFRSQSEVDSLLCRINKLSLKREKDNNWNFNGFDLDTMLFNNQLKFAARFVKKDTRPKSSSDISANTFFDNNEITIKISNSVDDDSVWLAKSLFSIQTIKIEKIK